MKLGLIGYPLYHSFSRKYFTEKFKNLGLKAWSYELYPLTDVSLLGKLLEKEKELIGLNVTIPYKVAVIPLLQKLDTAAKEIGAVNTIKVFKEGLKGYNTDVYGFEESLKPLLRKEDQKALVLGSGGASRAVCYVLEKLGIAYQIVSRQAHEGRLLYKHLDDELISSYQIIINATPLGMYPLTESFPPIPYDSIGSSHLLYDLVYNPEETIFLNKGKEAGARVKNGMEMLSLQAERAWEIWNTAHF